MVSYTASDCTLTYTQSVPSSRKQAVQQRYLVLDGPLHRMADRSETQRHSFKKYCSEQSSWFDNSDIYKLKKSKEKLCYILLEYKTILLHPYCLKGAHLCCLPLQTCVLTNIRKGQNLHCCGKRSLFTKLQMSTASFSSAHFFQAIQCLCMNYLWKYINS